MVRSIIRDICRREGITRYRLALMLGIRDASLSEWYNGKKMPTKATQTLLKAVQRLGATAVLSGELSQPIEPQANDRLKIT